MTNETREQYDLLYTYKLQTGVWRRSPASWSFWKYLMLLCSVIRKCNDTQQADKLFADKRESIHYRALEVVCSCSLVSTLQGFQHTATKKSDTCTTQNRSCKAVSLVPTSDFQSTTGKNIQIFCVTLTQSEHLLRVKIKFWYVLLLNIL